MTSESKILIVEDDKNLCRTIELILKKKGYSTECAYSASQALNKSNKTKYVLALLDIQLPDMNGHDLLQRLQKWDSSMSFIMITGFASLESVIESVKQKVIAYITKPLDMEFVLSTIDSFMKQHKLQRERTIFQRKMERQREELEIYSSMLRHDVLNDLQIIISNIECIQHFSLDACDEVQDLLTGTLAAAERMIALTKVLGISKKGDPEKVVTILRKIAEQTEKANRGLCILISAGEGTQNVVVKGGRLLPMVFENLFRNAAKYAGDFPKVEVVVSRYDDKIEFIVSDDGPGIDEEIQDHLFERGTTTSGSGLGLYLSRRIIELSGGSIELVQNNELGATFRIELDIVENHF
jgi:signal transduction histidine kinase